MPFEPREYQKAAIHAVMDAHSKGKRQLLLRLPTGAGKTVISALIVEQLLERLSGKRVLFLAHRREIIDQTAEKFMQQLGLEAVTIEQAERNAHPDARVVIASVQTLVGRLESYPPESFGALIIDECHHAYAKTWMDVIGHFGSQTETLLLGLTATPKRSDGRCVGELFKETVFEISLSELQDQGYLVPMDYFTIEASLGLGELSMDQSGDFQAALLGKIMNSPEVRELTVTAWLQQARSQKTIAFCASVEHAKDLAASFAEIGIKAAFISGETQDRTALIDAFRAGQIQFLSNFGVLTEGFDDPSIECVLLARPTTSPLVYSQCLGRGLRSHPGKHVCTVIDIVDRQRQQLQYNAFEAAGLKRSWRGSGKDPLREAAAIARIRVTDPGAFLRIRDALSLKETQDILMGLDPRIVLAGIDGMPLVRYQSVVQGETLADEKVLELTKRIFEEAAFEVSSLRIDQGRMYAELVSEDKLDSLPYLAWHVEQATACKIELRIQVRPLPEKQDIAPVIEDHQPKAEPIASVTPLLPTVAQEKKPNLGLKARLDRIVHEAQALLQDPTPPAGLKAAPAKGGGGRAGLSIQDRMKAIKSEHR